MSNEYAAILKKYINKLLWLIVSLKFWGLIATTVLLIKGFIDGSQFAKIWMTIYSVREVFKNRNIEKILKLKKRK